MVHELITGFTDNFTVGVTRENDDDCTESPINCNGTESIERPASEMLSEISVNSAADSITGELEASQVTEDHIAEIISGESEVLKDHNVIG